jgi:hypothetical protein
LDLFADNLEVVPVPVWSHWLIGSPVAGVLVAALVAPLIAIAPALTAIGSNAAGLLGST